jgi:ABC-2 type transport system ATP-binding protein
MDQRAAAAHGQHGGPLFLHVLTGIGYNRSGCPDAGERACMFEQVVPHAPAAAAAIDIRRVDKVYRGQVQALNGVAVQVRRGEIFGLLGPNGAGKSTLVKILTSIVAPTRVEGHLLGMPIGHKPTLARVGYLPEHHRLPEYLTGAQVLDHYAALSGMPRAARHRRRAELLDLVGMQEWAGKRVRQYSKGMRQRIGVAQALMHDPDLVILDEPTDGVDPVGRRGIRWLVQQLKERGKTVLINSHLLGELEMVCDRVAILVRGRVVRQGMVAELTRDSCRYEVTVRGEGPAWVPADRLLAAGGEACRFTVPGADPEDLQPIIDRLRREARTIIAIAPLRESLEDLFMRTVGGEGEVPAGGGGSGR